jgi:hypothetical protein
MSHWIGKGWFRGSVWEGVFNLPWNLKPMRGLEHALSDPQRFARLEPSLRAEYAAYRHTGLAATLHLLPTALGQIGYGTLRMTSSWLDQD